MSFDYTTLITDRANTDVNHLKLLKTKNYAAMSEAEKAVWDAALRGAYNASDMNRITDAMVYLKRLYEQYGLEVSYTPVNIPHEDGTTDTIWRVGEVPTPAQAEVILQNILAFWVGVERASGDVVEVWADSRFGYVEVSTDLSAGDYVSISAAHGILELLVTVQSDSISSITAAGTGWVISASDSALAARYTVPNGAFQDLREALDTLVFLCSAEKYADASVTVSALMRSGGTVQIGNGVIRWSNIINWEAFEAYAYTWQDVENEELTWEMLEALPAPETGGTT